MIDGPWDVEAFGTEVPRRFREAWLQGSSTQVIGQAELFPVFVSMVTWAEKLRKRHVLVFLDQDAARQALVKAYSPSRPSAEIISAVFQEVEALEIYPWFSRVPTLSNAADAASRLDFSTLKANFPWVRVRSAKFAR
jgi:hypothetical protein